MDCIDIKLVVHTHIGYSYTYPEHEISLICSKEVTAWRNVAFIRHRCSFHKTWTKMCAQWQIRQDPVPSIVNLAMKATSAEQIAS